MLFVYCDLHFDRWIFVEWQRTRSIIFSFSREISVLSCRSLVLVPNFSALMYCHHFFRGIALLLGIFLKKHKYTFSEESKIHSKKILLCTIQLRARRSVGDVDWFDSNKEINCNCEFCKWRVKYLLTFDDFIYCHYRIKRSRLFFIVLWVLGYRPPTRMICSIFQSLFPSHFLRIH